ncbi:N-acetylglucosamine-specific PTS transporter subunit IIBC [Paenibacillus kobensis]|uniref:N-acetylglucosamine-specific PTS transporter subunit IIBC n=1 Tax=Paenibacillus kobensis TaxID=59841 RepID=UPI000FD95A6A|nr:N-acetylglucosamine-specific PTS transporter subunit IIBC [Paenibacillus kobensis]
MLAFLQKIGRSLQLPIAALPAAGLMLRFGAIDYVKDFHLGSFGEWLNHYIAPFLAAGGGAIFDNLPILFAIGISIGMAGDAVATLAAVIAYYVLTQVLSKIPTVFPDLVKEGMTLNMGVLGGILSGLVASYMYKRYHDIKLVDWLGFFSGKRFVPIITSLVMVIVGIVFGIIWGPVQVALDEFGRWTVELGGIGAFIFMTANRLLIPFGLHQVINTISWFQIGDFTDAAGKVVHGDLNRFFAGDPSAGLFMTGFFPIMMFAMPAVALAIIHTARPERRKAVSSIFVGAALTSFICGITEPLEFAFMFLAPVLYVVHALLTGLSGFIVTELGIHHGFTFSAGFLDYVINYPLAQKPLLLIPIGLAFAVVYYFLFRFIIVKFNLSTPGREKEEVTETVESAAPVSMDDKAGLVLTALGGSSNIKSIDACITRLRLVVNDDKAVDDNALKKLGAAGVIRLGKGSVQAIFGTQAEKLKDQIKTKL